jgi:hypothetical protein
MSRQTCAYALNVQNSMNLMALAVFSQFSPNWLDAFGASSYSKDIP